MNEQEKQILQQLAEVLPALSKEDKAYLLGLAEGMRANVKPAEEPV